MSGEEKDKLDQLFKNGLDVPDTRFEYNEPDWDDLEDMLDAHKKPRGLIVRLLPILSGVAAILLLFIGGWLFKPAQVVQPGNTIVKTDTTQKPGVTDQSSIAAGKNTVDTANKINNLNPANNSQQVITPQVTNTLPVYASTPGTRGHRSGTGINNNTGQASAAKVNTPLDQPVTNQPKQELIANNKTDNGKAAGNTDQAITTPPASTNTTAVSAVAGSTGQQIAAVSPDKTDDVPAVTDPASAARPKKIKVSSPSAFKPQFGLAMMVSPDINGVGSFQNGKVGVNIGLGFSVTVKRFTLSTGVGYSKKPYMADYNSYQNSGAYLKTTPKDVTADCRVLDIPINVDYNLYNKRGNSFSVGTGLSSYLMLKEKYTYNYTQTYTYGPTGYTVTNKNQHILGVLNLSATYAHRLNNKFSIAAQPYLKIPLTNIGNSQVKLQSAGVAVGLRWNINQSKTP